ncbi:hypothetical protein HUU05_15145 [candidate division KSB1 bacterium]|nr:hypothetical protein [candidate division KSB1 bacterium]
MQANTVRNEALQIIHGLPEIKLQEAVNYLRFLDRLREDQINYLEEYMENLGWAMLASEAAEKDWE